ncbi:MAG: dTDP-glucose 4,6-dehydratase [Lentilactobacillus hilgardii]|uniref:dTDP-glucose 4,6-dehydratase n=2 Tax=Lentilactobacillus hilgardii TaxID=1588 RepID=UPI001CC1E505|nr:dTDP-glucose 4,6-dehydratase [Lentilactobacillus hilgardii]MBZ2202497.1 dTDP-glucose 4,6-dehydratase [Lentilactobacillus hilgardii]MBZ2203273.1 dTDP-glucose 4,6-dehydratase [Lentilactobacillus hilgardii]
MHEEVLLLNILVTGGAGFIGSNFIHLLLGHRQSDRLINFDALTYAGNLDNLDDIPEGATYRFIKGDIADKEAVKKVVSNYQINVIVNFAAQSHVDRSIIDATPFVHTNIEGVNMLLEVAREYHLDKFVQVSTDEVYGSTPSQARFDEQTPLNPSSPYAATKASADLLALSYFKTFGTPVCITRSANNYGRYQFPEKLVPLMVTAALRGKKLPIYGNGQNKRDWLNVQDNCRAIEMVMSNGKPGQIYNIAGRQHKTNLQIVKIIEKQLAAIHPQVTFVKDRPANDQLYAIDDSKIRHELGWRPEFSFEIGMGDVIDWYVIHPEWWQPLLKRVKNR